MGIQNKELKISLIILAAGLSTRMRGQDKLLKEFNSRSILRNVCEVALKSQADEVNVILGSNALKREKTLKGLDINTYYCQDFCKGMGASIRFGIKQLNPEFDGVVIMLADMPDVIASDIDALIDSFNPAESKEICRVTTEKGRVGHPVLFGKRFFERLKNLKGDRGALNLLKSEQAFLSEVIISDARSNTDLNTPEDWEEWEKKNKVII